MKLLDLIELHQDTHRDAVLWIFRSGPKAGMSSRVWIPNSWAIVIKDQTLTPQNLEYLLYSFQCQGFLKPEGHFNILHGERFLYLSVNRDSFGYWSIEQERPDQIHG